MPRRLQEGKYWVSGRNERQPDCGRAFHGGGSVAGAVEGDFLIVRGHFLTGACARPPFRGDFPDVTGDFLTVIQISRLRVAVARM